MEQPNSNMEEESTNMANLNEDVLQEILIRLPDCKSAIRSSAVCKRWFSAVHNADFINAFNRRRDESDNNCLQFTFLVKHPADRTKFYDLFFPTEKADCLNFLSLSCKATIGASCGGFLLLCLGDRDFCICNPLTRRWRLLPRAPESGLKPSACGLVLSPNTRSNTADFKVVLIASNIASRFWIALQFCSETRSWTTESVAPVRYPIICLAEPCNGVLYWQEGSGECRGMLAYNPFSGAKEYVDLPGGGGGSSQGRRMEIKVMARLGAVRGRLRLAQTMWPRAGGPHALKVWELEDGCPREWRLVHNARPRLPSANARVIGFHPNGGTVFLECGSADVFRYEFTVDSVEKVSKFLNAVVPFQPLAVAHTSSWPKLIPDSERPQIRAERKKRKKI